MTHAHHQRLLPKKNIPKELDDIVMKALEKKPANRFQTMQEMLDAVRLLDSAYTLQVLRKLENQDQ
jgi:serine/threonine protein kinase